jgi:hypothetical protein
MVGEIATPGEPLRVVRLASGAWLVAVAVLTGAVPAGAQTTDAHTAQPERPTIATHAGTVAPGWVELEIGGEFDRNADRTQRATEPIVLKIGLGERAQFGLFASAVRQSGTSTGAGDLSAGVKWRFADGAPIVGRLAVLPTIKFPTGSESTGAGTGTTDASLVVISSHALGPVALDLNVGYTRRSGDGTAAPKNSTVWTIACGGPARGWLGWSAELYGYPGTSGPAGSEAIVGVLFGPTFTIRRWLVLDAGAILPVTGPQPRAAFAGATYNVGHF